MQKLPLVHSADYVELTFLVVSHEILLMKLFCAPHLLHQGGAVSPSTPHMCSGGATRGRRGRHGVLLPPRRELVTPWWRKYRNRRGSDFDNRLYNTQMH